MLIDWFTVGAQALNFVILVWLMKRFLYKPIVRAIDTREQLIAAELADADGKQAEAHQERDELQHKTAELDQQRAALLKQATDDANAERQRLLDEARKAADAASAKRQETLRADAKNLEQAIQRRTQQEVFAIARKALTELASASLEERLGVVFTRRLRELDGPAKAGLANALKAAAGSALVRSAFELPADQRAVIQNALNETFSADVHVQFEIAPDLVSGIELATNGQKVGWSIAGYLTSLSEGVDELLKKKDEAQAKAEAEAQAKAEHKAKAKAEAEAKAEPKAEAKAEAKAEPKAEAKAEPKADAKTEPKANAKSEPKAEVKTEPKAEVKTEPKADAKAAEPKAEAKTEPKADAKAAEFTAKAKTEPKADAKAEPKTDAKAAPKPDAKAEPKTDAKAAPKPEQPRPEAKSQ